MDRSSHTSDWTWRTYFYEQQSKLAAHRFHMNTVVRYIALRIDRVVIRSFWQERSPEGSPSGCQAAPEAGAGKHLAYSTYVSGIRERGRRALWAPAKKGGQLRVWTTIIKRSRHLVYRHQRILLGGESSYEYESVVLVWEVWDYWKICTRNTFLLQCNLNSLKYISAQ